MSNEYAELAEALSELMSVAMGDEESRASSTSKIRVALVDGELSMTGADDDSPGTLSFRGRRCVAEAFRPSPDQVWAWKDDSDYFDRLAKNKQIADWVDSVDSGAERNGRRIGYSDRSSDRSERDYRSDDGEFSKHGSEEDGDDNGSDDVNPEDYFYTTQCQDINHLRSLSLINRWTETEFVVSDDANDVAKLSESELDFFKFIFVFLSAADDLVNFNLGNLRTLFSQKDIHHYYVEQESIEAVHSRVYGIIQLMLFGNNTVARAEYVKKAVKNPAIVEKIKWLDSKVAECESVAEKYVLMMIIEGIYFSSSFAAIAYLRINNLFTVTCQLNTLISRDEAVHTTASCLIYNSYLKGYPKPTPKRIHSLFKEAVAIECEFLRSRAPADSNMLDLEAIYSYVRYSADRILAQINMPAIYDEPKPSSDFPMALMFTADNTNFFERRSTAYSGCVTNDL